MGLLLSVAGGFARRIRISKDGVRDGGGTARGSVERPGVIVPSFGMWSFVLLLARNMYASRRVECNGFDWRVDEDGHILGLRLGRFEQWENAFKGVDE
jgi:hypothetical protein